MTMSFERSAKGSLRQSASVHFAVPVYCAKRRGERSTPSMREKPSRCEGVQAVAAAAEKFDDFGVFGPFAGGRFFQASDELANFLFGSFKARIGGFPWIGGGSSGGELLRSGLHRYVSRIFVPIKFRTRAALRRAASAAALAGRLPPCSAAIRVHRAGVGATA